MRRIRVCQLISSLEPSSSQRCVYGLAGHLDRSRFEVQVAALGGTAAAPAGADPEMSVLDLGGHWRREGPAGLVGMFRRGRFDLVHTHLLAADLLGRLAAGLAGVPHLVHTAHVAEMRHSRWHSAYARILSSGCDRIVCASQWVARSHARRCGLPRRMYSVIPHGIDPAGFARDDELRGRLRSRWGVGDEEVVFAFIGRLDAHAGIDTLLSAVSHLGARGEPQHLVVAGSGPKRYMVETYAQHGEGGQFTRYLGTVADVRGVLSAADCFVMPDRVTGSPLAAAEAMAASLPLIATRAPGVSEVAVDGQTALMIPPGQALELAGAMARMALDREFRARLGSAGRQYVTERFSIDAAVEAHAALYGEIVAAGSRRRGSFAGAARP